MASLGFFLVVDGTRPRLAVPHRRDVVLLHELLRQPVAKLKGCTAVNTYTKIGMVSQEGTE